MIPGHAEHRRVFGRIRQLLAPLARFERQHARRLPRERHRARQQIAVDNLIEDARRQRGLGVDRLAEGAHLDGLRHARQPRQPLRPRRARNNAELHFRLADLRRGHRDAVVPRHCDL